MHDHEDTELGNDATVTTAAISTALKLYARTRWPLENDKARKAMLARVLKFTPRRVRSFYEAEKNAVPRTHETVAIERLIGRRIETAEQELSDARAEYRDVAEIASALWALAHGPDADYYGPQVDTLREALLGERPAGHRSGGEAGPRNQGRKTRAA